MLLHYFAVQNINNIEINYVDVDVDVDRVYDRRLKAAMPAS